MDLSKTGRFKRINVDRRVANKRLSNPGLQMRRRTGVAERVRVRAREMSVPTGSVSGAARAVASKLPIARIVIVFSLLALASFGLLIGVNAYAQSRQVTVRLDNGIYKSDVKTTARTVRELLQQCHLRVGPNDEVTPALNTRLAEGMSVMVSRAMIVYITSNGELTQQYMTGGTVQDALDASNIDYDQDDEISPSLNTKLVSGIRITHIVVQTETITETQYLKYSTVYQDTKSLLKGRTKVVQYGKQGIKTREIKVTYKDGLEVSRSEIGNGGVQQEPVSRIILKGTGSPTKPSKPSNGNSGNTGKTGNSGNTGNSSSGNSDTSATDGSTNYGGHYSSVRDEDLIVPPAPTQFIDMYTMTITAYTHTGRKTSRGGWPQYTRTREKPGTIAVNPNSIPYGTLLYVTGYGYCLAEDTGSNEGDSSRMGDVFMNTRAQCYKWGRRRNVTVYVVQTDFKR